MTPGTAVVEAALRSLFPTGVAVAAEVIVPARAASLWPEEQASIRGAVPKRLAEFVAGRSCARRVLAALGHAPAALPMDADRAAVWPAGLSGSIAHAADLAVAVGRRGAPLGVDIEPDAPIEANLWPVICSDHELGRLAGDTGRRVRHIFCAKEAVFKAQPSDHRALFGFDVVDLTLVEDRFDAQFLTDVGTFRAGQILTGRLAVVGGMVLAGVAR